MPHVIVKVWPGKTEEQKVRLAQAITRDITDTLQYGEPSISIAIEEVEPRDWLEQVYRPELKDNLAKLYKKPGYTEDDLSRVVASMADQSQD